MSVAPMLPNLRIGLKKRRNGKSDVPVKQRGSWPEISQNERRKNILHTFGNWCLLASTLKPEEREFVVDSGASMHMISKKDLSEAEMDTLTKSCSPTIVITVNGEVQTHEEAIVYVKELGIFLTMKVLENTPAVLPLGKLCDENGYFHDWINGQKPHLIKNGFGNTMQYGELRSDRGSWFVIEFFLKLSFFNINDTFILHLPQARLLHQPQLCQATVRPEHGKS